MELQNLPRPWNAIRRASQEQFTGEQYDAILRGEHPIEYVDEIYGAHLLSETQAPCDLSRIAVPRFSRYSLLPAPLLKANWTGKQ
jgi:hypothetical protein